MKPGSETSSRRSLNGTILGLQGRDRFVCRDVGVARNGDDLVGRPALNGEMTAPRAGSTAGVGRSGSTTLRIVGRVMISAARVYVIGIPCRTMATARSAARLSCSSSRTTEVGGVGDGPRRSVSKPAPSCATSRWSGRLASASVRVALASARPACCRRGRRRAAMPRLRYPGSRANVCVADLARASGTKVVIGNGGASPADRWSVDGLGSEHGASRYSRARHGPLFPCADEPRARPALRLPAADRRGGSRRSQSGSPRRSEPHVRPTSGCRRRLSSTNGTTRCATMLLSEARAADARRTRRTPTGDVVVGRVRKAANWTKGDDRAS